MGKGFLAREFCHAHQLAVLGTIRLGTRENKLGRKEKGSKQAIGNEAMHTSITCLMIKCYATQVSQVLHGHA